jgi:competence ComEA-like helix-hairpin-helix protein
VIVNKEELESKNMKLHVMESGMKSITESVTESRMELGTGSGKESVTESLEFVKESIVETKLFPVVLYERDRVVVMFFLMMLFVFFLVICSGTRRNVDDNIVLDYQFYIDPNVATKAEFQILPGIGKKLSQNIVIYRDSADRFDDVEDLRNVNLIGKKKLDAIKPFIKIKPCPPSD